MFTAAGTWFHTTTADLEAFAPEVVRRITIERLLVDAEAVLRAPAAVTLWGLLLVLWVGSPVQAAASAPIVYLAWSVVAPGLVTLPLVRVYKVLSATLLQGLAFVVVLSLLANQGYVAATWTGLAGFVVLRWGLVGLILDPLARILRRSLYRVDVADQALRAVIVRHALATGSPLPELEAMERRMLDFAKRRGASRREDS